MFDIQYPGIDVVMMRLICMVESERPDHTEERNKHLHGAPFREC